jgi:HEAT repeat protein
MWVLHFVDSPIATQAFRGAASQDPDPTIRLNAVAELLRRNDLSVLPIAKQVLMNPSSAQISVPWRLEEVEQNLSSAVAQVRDERAIPTLSEILKSSDVRARRGAALALRSTGSPNAEDALLSCLGDSDFQVRYWGVVGLAEITGQNEWRPLREDFKSNEQKYLRHWVEWRKTGAP